ncbi:PREDICTED: uncharacterized protein LOC106104841 isoform X2 [Papilio polytes]|uniref:uncharacterized protein LOC106104841 isoform X2 n=1 Tax=Papilio polytes TaxID=76194 RepID=UPI000675F6AF|nr:PREDICTED: uncharacterized protein LOC106104841 isoform X2 [Papilio polytes]
MDRQQTSALQNFDDPKTDILKKRLLKTSNTNVSGVFSQNSSQNVLLNTLRAPISSSMIVSSMQAPQSSMPITHNLVTHSIAPVKIHANNSPYPLQLSTVHVPVQIPGSTSNINVPVQLSAATNSMPLQITPVSLPLQVSGTTNVPVQLPAGETINVPLQLPPVSQNIQIGGQALPPMPLLQNAHSSIFHVHMGSNTRPHNIDVNSDMSVSSSTQPYLPDSTVQVKMNNQTSVGQVVSNSGMVQIPNTSHSSIQLSLPNTANSGTVQLRGGPRSVPHVVYIQTPTGLKPVTNTEVISQASTSGNPPQIIVANNSNIHLISNVNKPTISQMPKPKPSILAPANASQPIVIKPKSNDKMMVPVSIAPVTQGKQAIAYLGPVKKNAKNASENQSILISSNQPAPTSNNQKLFLTPMNMPKINNTKFILPVTLPATMASKGPIINLQIANGQIQNDPQGNITVMRDTVPLDTDMPLMPFSNLVNGKDIAISQSTQDKSCAISIQGSRAEPTGEQGEYTLSIPETNASMNDDIYTVSIEDEGGQTHEKSFTLAIPEKSKSLLNKNIIDRDVGSPAVAAPAILRRSYSDNSDRKVSNASMKRRISLCNENFTKKLSRETFTQVIEKSEVQDSENNDDHRVPSLFCDEKLEKELDIKIITEDSDPEDDKNKIKLIPEVSVNITYESLDEDNSRKGLDSSEPTSEEDPPGLIWNNGVAHLQGSGLQFQTNEFGLIDLISSNNNGKEANGAKYNSPIKQNSASTGKEKKSTSPEDMYRCEVCGCHGMAAEFITPKFCSLTCQEEMRKITQKKREKERLDNAKKRNKIKKLLMRKQADSDLIQDGKDKVSPYDSMPNDIQISEVPLLQMTEDFEDEKYPWMCGKNGFSWMTYLDICKAKAAPVKLFKDPFPYNRNGFKVGMRLEAIDPQHPSLFCVVSVAEVQGYRMRLHFDEFPDVYDFWVNADSINIFPPGWCEKNGRVLNPPAGYTPSSFFWPLYLKKLKAVGAPKHLFPHLTSTMVKPNGFRIGMKLEAEDVHNEMVCVASVADMLDHRLLVSFDSWDHGYDYWADPTSPHIHPVGWAEDHGYNLTPPNDYKETVTFSWETYLAETGAVAAPPRAFRPRPPQGFKPAMKLEVVDPRVPFLIRVASISEVKGHQVRVTFDGWPDTLSCWLSDDSPDMHPVGWCLKTGHPLEPPLTEEERSVSGPCGVGGCRGLGSARGGAHKQHAAAAACPYRTRAPLDPPDRLAPRANKSNKVQVRNSTPTSDAPKEKLPRGRPPKHKRVDVMKNEHCSDEDSSVSAGCGGKRWRGGGGGSERGGARAEGGAWPRALLAAHISELALSHDPVSWSQSEVEALVGRVAGRGAGAAAAGARLSGAELLMASCEELVACLRLRLGPAVKVYSAVRQLRDSLT